jgi:hypothetical protein
VIGLLIAGFAGLIIVLYTADLIVKARARARRLRRMSGRLAAAAARAEQQHRQRQAAASASRALTSVLPAINRPPGDPAHRPGPPRIDRNHPGPAEN